MLRIVDGILTLIQQVRPLADAVGRKDPSLAKQLAWGILGPLPHDVVRNFHRVIGTLVNVVR